MIMTGNEVIEAVSSLIAENKYLKSRISELESKRVDSTKFYDVVYTPSQVAKLHGVSPALVRKYVHMGLIETHPSSSDTLFLIRLSDALTIDFAALKRKAKELV